ncbi:hypothetical protein KQX54_012983 [Cotesia glomerata]|uniref:Uncharacterized protein n=1 Tax=Cotesia glomerata TaxID=32391 RepID=A0AAV7J7G4_COTGL|nr:hypothetical protein KQX54_012983 [Cotesia glomerata]
MTGYIQKKPIMAIPNLNVKWVTYPVEWDGEMTDEMLMGVIKLALQRNFLINGSLEGAALRIGHVQAESELLSATIIWFKACGDPSIYPNIINRDTLRSSSSDNQQQQSQEQQQPFEIICISDDDDNDDGFDDDNDDDNVDK